MIEFSCASCGQAFKVNDDWAGKRARCKKCGQTVNVPADIEEVPEALMTTPTQAFLDRLKPGVSKTARLFRWAAKEGYLWYLPSVVATLGLLVGIGILIAASNSRSLHESESRMVVGGAITFWSLVVLAVARALPQRARCPFCEERVAPKARLCKHCGHDLRQSPQRQPAASPASYSRRAVVSVEASRRPAFGKAAVLVVCGAVLVLGGSYLKSGKLGLPGRSGGDEQAAREHLRHELSDWMSGQRSEAWCPIENVDGRHVEPVVVNYDIKSIEAVGDGYSAVVALTLQSEAGGGLPRARTYRIEHDSTANDGWKVVGGHWNQ